MKIVKPSARIIAATPNIEQILEMAGRVCYKSEDRITEYSAAAFISRMHESKHESVLEHGAMTVHFVCDRGVSHELVRHRIASFTQESTRYCNYSQGKHGSEITFVDPSAAFGWSDDSLSYRYWYAACRDAEQFYMHMINAGATAQQARAVLPNSLKTELYVTANPREWLHIFKLRDSEKAHPQMVEIMKPLHEQFRAEWPAIFGGQ